MPFIDTPPETDASGSTAELYQKSRASYGYLPNMTKLFAHRPEVFEAWVTLNGAIKSNMDLRRYELVTIAAARELRSSYCMLAHGKVLLGGMLTAAELKSIVEDPETPDLAQLDREIMRYAAKLVRDAASVQQTDIDALRAHGLTDSEIFDIATAAAVRCFFSKTLDALGASPDTAYAAIEPEVRDALVVGRPIEASS